MTHVHEWELAWTRYEAPLPDRGEVWVECACGEFMTQSEIESRLNALEDKEQEGEDV
jgi:hypothetical protein